MSLAVEDWPNTIASTATGVGTLVLAAATFASVRSSNRAARATEAALLAGIRPVLAGSKPSDPEQKIGFVDDHWVRVPGGQASAQATDDTVYLTISLRNVGNGLAVLDRWRITPERRPVDVTPEDLVDFRRTTRDIYVPSGDLGFWQGAIRDRDDPMFDAVKKAIEERSPMSIDLLYGDHDGGQHTVSRFAILPGNDDLWLTAVSRHWNLDRPDPR